MAWRYNIEYEFHSVTLLKLSLCHWCIFFRKSVSCKKPRVFLFLRITVSVHSMISYFLSSFEWYLINFHIFCCFIVITLNNLNLTLIYLFQTNAKMLQNSPLFPKWWSYFFNVWQIIFVLFVFFFRFMFIWLVNFICFHFFVRRRLEVVFMFLMDDLSKACLYILWIVDIDAPHFSDNMKNKWRKRKTNHWNDKKNTTSNGILIGGNWQNK